MTRRLTPAERLARAEQRWQRAKAAAELARLARNDAIAAAHEAGLSLYEIADVIGTSHEVARRALRQAQRSER